MKKKTGIGLIAIIIFLTYFVFNIIQTQKIINLKNKELKEIEANQARVEEEAKQYAKRMECVNSDEYLQKVAKEKLGLLKPNEKIFVDVTQTTSNP